jgi:aspartyl/asparaginyl beta-hydroxylase (cupin superfamily)
MNNSTSINYPAEKPWYAFKGKPYKGPTPNYFDTSNYSWAKEMEQNFPAIRKEVLSYLEKHDNEFAPYFNTDMMSSDNCWKALLFKFWGTKARSLDDLPTFKNLLQKVPNVTSVALSKIKAGNEITWHPGDSNTFIRCHIPIIIPTGLPECGFQVNDEIRAWDEDKLLMFCDAHRHRAFNYSNQDRIILIFDFIREDFAQDKQTIIANAVSALWIQQKGFTDSIIGKIPGLFKGLLRWMYMVKLLIFNPIKL